MLEFFLESYYLFVDINLWNGNTVKICPRFLFVLDIQKIGIKIFAK